MKRNSFSRLIYILEIQTNVITTNKYLNTVCSNGAMQQIHSGYFTTCGIKYYHYKILNIACYIRAIQQIHSVYCTTCVINPSNYDFVLARFN